jgi:hypothetical protein
MMVRDSFDHRPDPVIGRLLREHLRTDDDAVFVARVLQAARSAGRSQGPASGEWDLLAGWFKPGIAAAAALLVAALVGVGVGERSSMPTSLAEALGPAEAPAELLAADAHPDPQVLLSPLLEAR